LGNCGYDEEGIVGRQLDPPGLEVWELWRPDEFFGLLHSVRLLADMLIARLGGEVFSWGGGQLQSNSELLARYVLALRAADAHCIDPLLAFVRS
jgi:hypothetical protein